MASCVALLLSFPVLAFLMDEPGGFLKNWIRVLTGKISWVGLPSWPYPGGSSGKQSVLTPEDGLPVRLTDENMVSRLNVLYAKDYSVYTDLRIVSKALRRLGRKTR